MEPGNNANKCDARLWGGLLLMVVSNLLFIVPFMIQEDWPRWAKTVAGAMIFAPDLGTLAAVGVMGKENFDRIVSTVKGWLKRTKPAGNVGKVRHRIGIVLFLSPLLVTYTQGYFPQYLPDVSPWRLYANIASDLIFLISLFVLGGDFWDKLRALFLRDARAVFVEKPSEETP